MLHANWWEGLSFKVVGLKVLGVVQQRLEDQIRSEIVSGRLSEKASIQGIAP